MIEDNNLPLVSICCVTYNHAPYIRQCLDGFIMQKSVSFEVLIHDDASTDETANIIREYELKYPNIIKPIYQIENQYSKGISPSITFNFPRAKGKYIAMCEGDDYWTDPYKLQKQVDFLENNPDHSCCVHEYKEWIENQQSYRQHQLTHLRDKSQSGISLNCNDYAQGSFFTKTLTAVFRKDALDNSKYSQYETKFDMAMFFALSTQGKIYLMNDIMGVYRMHDGGCTSDYNREQFYMTTIPKLFSICESEKSDFARKYVYIYIHEYPLYFLLYRRDLAKKCLVNLGLKYNIKLFFVDLSKIIFDILKTKLSITSTGNK